MTTTVDKMHPRPGGDWRFICTDSQGETAFRGTYREIRPPELVSETFEWEGMPGHVLVESAALEDLGGRTKVTPRCCSTRPRSATACSRRAWRAA